MFANGETVLIRRAPLTTDPYSQQKTSRDWDAAVDSPVDGCGVADGGSTEPVEAARSSVESDFDVIMPSGTDILPTDRMVVRGLVCEVLGRVFDWRSPFTGWSPGMVAKVKIVEG